ncbi:MAG: DUF4350 domain-containing protein [Betaproteobacteria bacterium]|nr:DUF4350 domain-containing protein [Betaproteobacteria bacterium]
MKISTGKLVRLLLLSISLLFLLWLYTQTETVEVKLPAGFQGAAANNPLLAAGRLIERYGAIAHYVPAYSKPPKPGATLVFTAPRYWLAQKQNDALLEWVEKKGGHLIVSLRSLQDFEENVLLRPNRINDRETDFSQDSLLAFFGISVKLRSKAPAGSIELPDGTRLKARFQPFSSWLLEDSVKNSDWQISEPTANIENRENKGNYALSYTHGKGRVTVLTSLDFIGNRMIGEGDNAALFVYLVSLAKGQDIWLVYGSDAPALWRWFVDHAWAVLIAAALLLIAWLWMISRRFGPLLPARPAARRSIVEHVAASARYLWRNKQGQMLYQTLCNDFYKQAYLHHPQWGHLPKQELNRQIVLFANESRIPQLSGLTEDAVEHLLDASRPRNENQFTANSHLLDILRNRL